MRQENKVSLPSVVPPSLPRSTFPTITLEDTLPEQKSVGHSFTASLKVGCPIFYARDESAASLDSGATANLACFQWLRRPNELLASRGFPAASTYQAHATFKFGGGRTGEVCHAADTAVGVAGIKGVSAAFALDSDIPALLSDRALATLLGRLDFARDTLTLGTNGKVVPLQMSEVGHYFLSAADFSRPTYSAPLYHWATKTRETRLRGLMRNGVFRWVEELQVPARSVSDKFTPSATLLGMYGGGAPGCGQCCDFGPQKYHYVIAYQLGTCLGYANLTRLG